MYTVYIYIYIYTNISFSVGILFSFHMLCAVKVNLVKNWEYTNTTAFSNIHSTTIID